MPGSPQVPGRQLREVLFAFLQPEELEHSVRNISWFLVSINFTPKDIL